MASSMFLLRTREKSLATSSFSKWLPRASPYSTIAPAFSTAYQQEPDKKGGPLKLFLYASLMTVTFGVGNWHMNKRQENIELLENRVNRMRLEPLKGNEISPSNANMDSLKFRRILFKGTFDEKKLIYIGPFSRITSGVIERGYYLITPLLPVPSDHDRVQFSTLVNRGWVPERCRYKTLDTSKVAKQLSNSSPTTTRSWWQIWFKKPEAKVSEVKEHISVIGVMSSSEKPGILVPADHPSYAKWAYGGVHILARICGLPEDTIYIEATEAKKHRSHRALPHPQRS